MVIHAIEYFNPVHHAERGDGGGGYYRHLYTLHIRIQSAKNTLTSRRLYVRVRVCVD
jgi:hypothetical protein